MDATQQEAHLAELAYDLEQGHFRTELAETGTGPVLTVRNPAAPQMVERIHVQGEHYMWPWGQPVAPIADKALATRRITRVLAAVGAGPC
ncbi:hypothetical protein [Actinomadura hibisca]|uniref:hypothetical protein n=1 Tax=Actinomadura hibisca TaxID=68565 RepID=UPI0008344924|nr:hypothetical protein [Actinomadura hibisca]